MKIRIGHIIKTVFAFAVLWTSLSCNFDLSQTVVKPDKVELNVGFRMATKAPGDKNYEEGETYESVINVSGGDFRIYFFDSDNRFISRFNPSGFIATEGSGYREYSVAGTTPSSLVVNNRFKVVVLANWPTYPDEDKMRKGLTTIEDLCNDAASQFDQFTSFSLNDGHLIPFYGIREFIGVHFEPDVTTVLSEPVSLLRAVAKAEVILKTDSSCDLSFGSVQVCRYNQKGYCAPEAYSRSDYDHDGVWDDDYAESLHLVNGKNDTDRKGDAVDKRLPFLKVDTWEENGSRFEKWIAYLTEYQNVGANDGYCFIEATFSNQLEGDSPHKIYFAEYSDGLTDNADARRLNVERNNLYRFNVVATPIQFLVSVDEWVYGGKVHIEM